MELTQLSLHTALGTAKCCGCCVTNTCRKIMKSGEERSGCLRTSGPERKDGSKSPHISCKVWWRSGPSGDTKADKKPQEKHTCLSRGLGNGQAHKTASRCWLFRSDEQVKGVGTCTTARGIKGPPLSWCHGSHTGAGGGPSACCSLSRVSSGEPELPPPPSNTSALQPGHLPGRSEADPPSSPQGRGGDPCLQDTTRFRPENIITEIKDSVDGLNNWMERAEERASEFQDRTREITQSEWQRGNRPKSKSNWVPTTGTTVTKICPLLLRTPEKEEQGGPGEELEEIMTENSLNLAEDQ